jgi:hypothetical protein
LLASAAILALFCLDVLIDDILKVLLTAAVLYELNVMPGDLVKVLQAQLAGFKILAFAVVK